MTGTSSNTALVPTANIVFGGSGASRTVTITPAANQSGTATITLTVTDGDGGTASDSFVLTVTAVNDLPTISDVTDKTTNEDIATPAISFTIGDVETAAASLTVTGEFVEPRAGPDGQHRVRRQRREPDGHDHAGGESDRHRDHHRSRCRTASGGTASDTFVLTVTGGQRPADDLRRHRQDDERGHRDAGLSFTIGDVETAAASLTVTGGSSNPALVPTANIVFGGSGANRTVTITPAANQTGTATITVTVSDGSGGTAGDTFVLTVTGVNDLPTISDVTDKTTALNTASGPHTFTVGDAETAAAALTVAGASSNLTLVPVANIAFGGSGSQPDRDDHAGGGAVGHRDDHDDRDGRQRRNRDRQLRADGVGQHAPTISDVTDQTTNEDTATAALGFTVGDIETPAASLTVTGGSSNTALVPTANIVFGGSGANRTVTITPAANQIRHRDDHPHGDGRRRRRPRATASC